MNHDNTHHVVSTPPVAVAGMVFAGLPLSDWVQIAALAWIVLQAGYFVYSKLIKKTKE
jgi:hypothetical protein